MDEGFTTSKSLQAKPKREYSLRHNMNGPLVHPEFNPVTPTPIKVPRRKPVPDQVTKGSPAQYKHTRESHPWEKAIRDLNERAAKERAAKERVAKERAAANKRVAKEAMQPQVARKGTVQQQAIQAERTGEQPGEVMPRSRPIPQPPNRLSRFREFCSADGDDDCYPSTPIPIEYDKSAGCSCVVM